MEITRAGMYNTMYNTLYIVYYFDRRRPTVIHYVAFNERDEIFTVSHIFRDTVERFHTMSGARYSGDA